MVGPWYSTLETRPLRPAAPAGFSMLHWSVRTAIMLSFQGSTLWPPMKRATNALAGCSNTSAGEPVCLILPPSMTTMRSASAIASSWA